MRQDSSVDKKRQEACLYQSLRFSREASIIVLVEPLIASLKRETVFSTDIIPATEMRQLDFHFDGTIAADTYARLLVHGFLADMHELKLLCFNSFDEILNFIYPRHSHFIQTYVSQRLSFHI